MLLIFFIPLLFADLPISRHIVELTSTSEVREDNNTFWLVVFCDRGSQCTDLMFEYVKLADHLSKTPNAKFGRVDCTTSGEVCTFERIGNNFPKVRLYYKGSLMDYESLEKDEKSITAWYTDSIANDGAKIKNFTLPTTEFVKPLNDWEPFKAATAKEASDFWFIVFYRDGGANCRKLIPIFNAVSIALSNVTNLKFGRVDCPNAGTICHKIRAVPSFQLFYQGQSVVYDANRELNSVDMISTWIIDGIRSAGGVVTVPELIKLPASEYVRTFTDLDSLRAVQSADSAVFWLITYYRDNCPHCRRWIPTFNALATLLKDKQPNLKFGRVDCRNSSTAPLCDAGGVRHVPQVTIYYKGSKANYDDNREADLVTKWLTKVMANDGDLVKNPPPPPQLPKSDNVVQLNDTNFPPLVENATGEDFWFLTFYRSNCPHCQNFIPTLNTLSDQLTGTIPHLKFGRVECLDPGSAVICTAQKTERVPAIRLYYKGSQIELNVSREIDSVTNWIKEGMLNDGAKVRTPTPPSPPTPTPISTPTPTPTPTKNPGDL